METHTYHLRIGAGRRIVLPTEICRDLGFDIGDNIVIRVDDGKATLNSVDQSVKRFQALVASKVQAGASLVDELIAERESAAMHE